MKKLIMRLLPARFIRRIRYALDQSRAIAHRLRWSAFAFREAAVGIGTFDGFDIAYRIGSVDPSVLQHSFEKDIFFPAIPEYSLPADGVVLDVGAHIGTFSLLAATKAPKGRVFAIEASRDTFDLLRANVSMSGLPNIRVDHLALTDRAGMVKLHHDPDGNYGHSVTKQLSSSSEAVPAATLPQYLEDRDIGRIDLIKFNCEGAEFSILLSTPAGILRRIRKMIVLYHCDLVEHADVSALTGHLAASGFETRTINQTEGRGWIIATR